MKPNIFHPRIRLFCFGAAVCLAACLVSVKGLIPEFRQSGALSYTFVTLKAKNLPGISGTDAVAATSWRPHGLVLDGKGSIYFSDPQHQVICKMTAAGSVTIVAGKWNTIGSADGMGNRALFRFPHGLAMDGAGNLFVADSGNDTIRRISPAGVVGTLAGRAMVPGSADGARDAARFNYPFGLAMDRSGIIYVTDFYNFTVRRVAPDGAVTTLAGNVGETSCVDGPAAKAEFGAPTGVAADCSGNLYVADMSMNSIRKISTAGKVSTLAGQMTYQVGHTDGKGSAAEFNHPCGLVLDSAGNIYVADTDNNSIRRIGLDGTVVTLAGLAGQPGLMDGTGSAVRLGYPFNIALDAAGNLYVSDLCCSAVRKGFASAASNLPVTLTER